MDDGYSLYVMRSLPEGVPPINDLKKRRLLHLPSDGALPMLEHIVRLKMASETATNMDVSLQIKRAEKDVKSQFKSAQTVSVINPILRHLGSPSSLDMWMMENEKYRFECEGIEFTQADILRLADFTKQAISDIEKDPETEAYLEDVISIIRGR